MKQAGYNAVRCAHNPASRALLDACDRLGIMLWMRPLTAGLPPKHTMTIPAFLKAQAGGFVRHDSKRL